MYVCLWLFLLLEKLVVRTEYLNDLVDVHLLHVLTSGLEILTGIKVAGVLSKILADSGSHGQT